MGAFITTRNISKGEELFSNYGPFYASVFDKEDADKSWYYELWQDYKERNADKEDFIDSFENAAKTVW